MSFVPPRCPLFDCPSAKPDTPFLWRHRGFYLRACDGRTVQRFLCLTCSRSFSAQSFRLDYRHRKPHLNGPIFDLFISKVSHRQAARILGTRRRTIERRLPLFGAHARLFQLARLDEKKVAGIFQLDELETFETRRRLQPVTMALLLEKESRFFVHLEAAPMAARGKLSKREQAKKHELEALHGKRKSGSSKAVRACFEALERHHGKELAPIIHTDLKSTYPAILKKVFPTVALVHKTTHSKRKRDTRNALFAINHSLAMLRDGISRLVRRSWCHAKKRARLELHAWIYLLWRNYVRGVSNKRRHESPAMAIGIEKSRWSRAGILRFSARFPELLEVQ